LRPNGEENSIKAGIRAVEGMKKIVDSQGAKYNNPEIILIINPVIPIISILTLISTPLAIPKRPHYFSSPSRISFRTHRSQDQL